MVKLRGLDVPSLVAAILDPAQVPDAVMPRLMSALGTADREDTAALVQSDEQAAAVALKIVKPLLKAAKKVTSPVEMPLSPVDASAVGAVTAKKGAKARVQF